jgi:ABC-type transport system involved in cytochrome bd biosynthesis fused ATPase/permease subunit
VVLQDGEFVEQGTHRELLARDGVYARMCRSQERGNPETQRSRACAIPRSK